jgi:NAD+ diphosphatase
MSQQMSETLNLPLARAAVDRDYLSRSRPELFDELWANPQTRVLVMHQGKTLLYGEAETPAPVLRLLTVEQVPSAQLRVYLGTTTESSSFEGAFEPIGTPVVLAVVSDNSANQVESNTNAWHQLRKNGAGLSARDSGLFSQALAIANWHEKHQYCPSCGTPTLIEQGGWVRRCFKDNQEIYPRTDPAIICAVTDSQDRILLGSQGAWQENRWSVLAGFVEPGESLAAAVVREVFEEAGVRVGHPEYLGSQAWPFPYSLMVGFTAKVNEEHALAAMSPTPDGIEIEKLRWFTRDEMAAEARHLLLPSRISIARALIEHWFQRELPNP